MTYTFKDETEKLQNLKTGLENIITVIEAEQKILEEEMKPIRQKVAILELKKSVRRRRDELSGLPIQRAKREDK
jgi:CII-binding regulator of phage lambda lysogenization HflD